MKNCGNCGQEFNPRASGSKQVYCSHECRYSAHYSASRSLLKIERPELYRASELAGISTPTVAQLQKYNLAPKFPECFNLWYRAYLIKRKAVCNTRYRTKYKEKRKAARRSREAWRRKNDPAYIAKQREKARENKALRGVSATKSGRTVELRGCTDEQFCEHIESQFARGMGWHNRHKWHIDHIVPLSSFDLTKSEEQKKAFHFTNKRPLWKQANMDKLDKIIPCQPELLLRMTA